MAKTKVGTVALLLTEDGYFWMGERVDKDRPYCGMLAAPGGSVDEGETPLSSIVRELREETKLDIRPSRFHYGGETEHAYDDGNPFTMHWYIVTLQDSEVPQNTEPHKQGPWKKYLTDDLTKLNLTPGTLGAIQGLTRRYL